MRLPVYTHHKIPPRVVISDARAERRLQAARDSLPPLSGHSDAGFYDLPAKTAPFPRWQTAAERLLPFFADVLPTWAAGIGSTWALLLIADCIARATS